MNHLEIPDLGSLDKVATQFLADTAERKIYAFYAPMGTGKTTFITALCRSLGISDIVNSPTFAIVNSYSTPKGETLYHIDCYRLDKLDDALNVGMNDYLDSGARCFIEWPEVIDTLLPDDTLRVQIVEKENGIRELIY